MSTIKNTSKSKGKGKSNSKSKRNAKLPEPWITLVVLGVADSDQRCLLALQPLRIRNQDPAGIQNPTLMVAVGNQGIQSSNSSLISY